MLTSDETPDARKGVKWNAILLHPSRARYQHKESSDPDDGHCYDNDRPRQLAFPQNQGEGVKADENASEA
jgi:hypothetical protein